MMSMEWIKSEQEQVQVQQQAEVEASTENSTPKETTTTACTRAMHMDGGVGSRASASGYGTNASRRIETKAAVAVRDLVRRFERCHREEPVATDCSAVGRLDPSRFDAFRTQRKNSETGATRMRTMAAKDKSVEDDGSDGVSVDAMLSPIKTAEVSSEEPDTALHLDFEMMSMCSSQEVETVTATASECGTDADCDIQGNVDFVAELDSESDTEGRGHQQESSGEESEPENRSKAGGSSPRLSSQSSNLHGQRKRHEERIRDQQERGGEGGKGRVVRPGHRPTGNHIGQGFPYQREVAPKYLEYAADKNSSYWRRLEIALARRGVVGGESG